MALKESKLSLQMAGDQRKLAWISKRETSSMKVLSLLGTIFLPGAFLAVRNNKHASHKWMLITWEVCLLNDFFWLPQCTRHGICSIPSILALLGRNHPLYGAYCVYVAIMGEEKSYGVREGRHRHGKRCGRHGRGDNGRHGKWQKLIVESDEGKRKKRATRTRQQ